MSLLCNRLADQYKILIFVHQEGGPFFPLDPRIRQIGLQGNVLQKNQQLFKTLKREQADYYINLDSNSVLFNGFLLPSSTRLMVWEHFSLENNSQKWTYILSRFYASLRSNKIVVLSNAERKMWHEKYLVKTKKIVVINNPVTIDKDQIDNSNKRNRKRVLAIGNKVDVKGFDLLVRAWKKIKTDWKLDIIGLPESEQIKLAALIEERELKNVHLYPKQNAIAEWYKNAAFFVLSSRKEAAPLILMESQAYGLPLVCFDHLTSVRELAGDSVLYADFKEREDALAQQIQRLIDSEELYNRYHKKSIINSKKFTQSEFIDKWKMVLED